jgi:hypothetical protein
MIVDIIKTAVIRRAYNAACNGKTRKRGLSHILPGLLDKSGVPAGDALVFGRFVGVAELLPLLTAAR